VLPTLPAPIIAIFISGSIPSVNVARECEGTMI
jgi:hypothetical protein